MKSHAQKSCKVPARHCTHMCTKIMDAICLHLWLERTSSNSSLWLYSVLPTYFEITCPGSKYCWVGGLKFGYFSSVYSRQHFFLQICQFGSFLSIQRVFEPFQCPRTFFSSISGIKTSCCAFNIDYPLHAKVNNLIVLPPKQVIWIILRLKASELWKLGYFEGACHG